MRILILGGDGMLGHQLLLSWSHRHEVLVTLRQLRDAYSDFDLFDDGNSVCGVDIRDAGAVETVFRDFSPDAVINAVGIVKQRPDAADAVQSIEINALAPHRLSGICERYRARLVHLSTDCVFSGNKGLYTEDDPEDARDLYGRSKLLGELHYAHTVTLRTSIIGLELTRKKSLIEWFLAQSGEIRGFTRAIYSGFTTMEMARIIERVLLRHPDIHGLWHVASQPISKYDLLCQFSEKLHRQDIHILEDDSFVCDRSLDGSRFERQTGYSPPSWEVMLDELAEQVMERRQ